MGQPDKDTSVLGHITRLADEEHGLFGKGKLSHDESRRLAAIQVELDQCWDLLRQRRALREFGADLSQAQVRDANVVPSDAAFAALYADVAPNYRAVMESFRRAQEVAQNEPTDNIVHA
jgi:hypothetical protein